MDEFNVDKDKELVSVTGGPDLLVLVTKDAGGKKVEFHIGKGELKTRFGVAGDVTAVTVVLPPAETRDGVGVVPAFAWKDLPVDISFTVTETI